MLPSVFNLNHFKRGVYSQYNFWAKFCFNSYQCKTNHHLLECKIYFCAIIHTSISVKYKILNFNK